jgi:hypothetical protein
VTSRQYWILAGIAALAVFIGVGITLIATSGDDKTSESIEIGTTSSTSPIPLPPAVLPTASPPPTVPGTPSTPGTVKPGKVTPGTTLVIPSPSTTAATHPEPTTTRPAPTTTRPPPTTTTRPPTTTTTEPGHSDVGITATEIHLAVIADDPQTFEGMTAWQTAVNRHSGLADRKVRLDLYATNGSAEGYADAVRTACERDFAIVGSYSRFDAAPGASGCGAIPDLPVEAVNEGHIGGEKSFAAFPRRTTTVAVGPYRWLLDNVPGCCKQYVLVPDAGPERTRTLAEVDAAGAVGFTSAGTADVSPSDPPARYDDIVAEIEDTGATFGASGLGRDSTVLLRQAAAGHAAEVKAWYCNASCYDSAFLADGGDAIEKQYVSIETTPFGDRSSVGSLRTYVRTTVQAGDGASYPGLRAYVAGLLFEQVAKQVVTDHGKDGLTRVRLLDALAAVHDFAAGGIVGPTDVGARTPNGCYVLVKVRDGRFTRINPADKGALSCGAGNLVELGP